MTQGDDRYITTVGIDYQYARRANANRKELMSSYELGGGREQNKVLTTPLSKENYRDAFYVVIVDLSAPHSLIDSLTFWLEEIRKQVALFNNEQFTSAQDLEAKSNFDFALQSRFESHSDKTRIKPMPIQTLIVGSKYDVFEKMDAENRKWIVRTLRYIAHVNGASLYFSASNKNLDVFQNLRSMINTVLFGQTLPSHFQTDHLRAIAISAGKDELARMGLPPLPSANMTYIDTFKKVITESVPINDANSQANSGNSGNNKDIIGFIEKFPEARIDSIRLEKDKQMKAYSKQFENLFEQQQKNNKQFDASNYEEIFETSKSQQQLDREEAMYAAQQGGNMQSQQSQSYQFQAQQYQDNNIGSQNTSNQQQKRTSYQSSAPVMIGGGGGGNSAVPPDQARVNPYLKSTGKPAGSKTGSMQPTKQAGGGLSSLGGLPQIS